MIDLDRSRSGAVVSVGNPAPIQQSILNRDMTPEQSKKAGECSFLRDHGVQVC
jgi:hypothetical protein